MGDITPAGGLTKRDLRILLIRSTTFQAISITLLATVGTIAFKLQFKQDPGSWTWAVPFLPAIAFLMKRLILFAYREASVNGVRINERLAPEAPGLARSVAAWHGMPRPDVVGFGPRAEISVTALKPWDLKALKQGRIVRRQKVSVKIGTPLLLTLSTRQLAVLLSFHLAVLNEPFPVPASALIQRGADFATAKPGGWKARRAAAFAERSRGFTADVNARGMALAERAAGSRQAAQEVFAAAAVVMRDFEAVEERLKTLSVQEEPRPSALYYGWAVSRRAARSMCPGEAPLVDSLSVETDKRIVSAWNMTVISPWRGVLSGSRDGDDKLKVEPGRYDYSWLLADPYGLRSQAAEQRRSAWSQY